MSHLPEIIHLGGIREVTGSAHLVREKGLHILVDCGLAQGGDEVPSIDTWPVEPSRIDYLIVTHAHIDHIGRIPDLIDKGFTGEILCTHPTKALLVPMLEDAMGFTNLSDSRKDEITLAIDRQSWGFEYGEDFELREGISLRFRRAGHILGSSFVRLAGSDPPWSVIFSGDLGAKGKPFLHDPDPPDHCDLLLMESTYGGTIHEGRRDRVRRLGKVLSHALSDRGKVYIPTFALGRTQELIYEMNRLVEDPELREEFPIFSGRDRVPVFLDSPLGLKLTEVYSRLVPFWDREARELLEKGDNPLDFAQLFAASRHIEHLALLQTKGPCIIMAGSGMCTGGRIIAHLKSGIEDPKNDIVFVGYQSSGTPGRSILEYADKPDGWVELDGQRHTIRAGVHVLTGYSGHADQRELLEWLQAMDGRPGLIRLIHGDAPAREALGSKLKELGYAVEWEKG